MEVETIETDSNHLVEILKQAAAGDEIILESDLTDGGDGVEVEEIVEIIEEIEEIDEEQEIEEVEVEEVEEVEEEVEEIEEVEEVEELEELEEVEEVEEIEEADHSKEKEHSDENDRTRMKPVDCDEQQLAEVHETNNGKCTSDKCLDDSEVQITPSRSKYVKKQLKNHFMNESNKERLTQVVTYDVAEDWEDEDLEQGQVPRRNSNSLNYNDSKNGVANHGKPVQKHDSSNISENQEITQKQSIQMGRDHNSINNDDSRTNENSNEYWDEEGQESMQSYEDEQMIVRDNENTNAQHEIVKNMENNLLYTVLTSKKQNSTTKQKYNSSRYIKMEQMDDNSMPVDGTIYYENEDMDTMYVTQSVDDNDSYQYNNSSRDSQGGECIREDEDTNDREESSQEQIFLHEDEDGQLYFKNDSGKLQPVYLTADGNYAIADNSSDDQDSRDQMQQGNNSRQLESGAVLTPATDYSSGTTNKTAVVPASTVQELDNEDNTVTISLIISEDENGIKRTQVIIPTTDNLKCETCNKSFKTSFQLLRHNRLKHAREEELNSRPYHCDLCPKRYPDQNSLARHQKTHTGNRPFQCLECHKTFPSSTALRRHLTLHNPHLRPLPCIYCGRRFLDKSSLAKHQQSHLSGEQRTHSCDICNKAFSHANDLLMHKKNHDPERKFNCEVCGREFNRLNNLQRHMMVHKQQKGNNEEALSCDVCGITYRFMSSLTRHMVTTHVNPEKMRQQAEEQRRKRENNYRRYVESRQMQDYQPASSNSNKRNSYHQNTHAMTIQMSDNDGDA